MQLMCVNNTGMKSELTVGVIYEIEEHEFLNMFCKVLCTDKGHAKIVYRNRFEERETKN